MSDFEDMIKAFQQGKAEYQRRKEAPLQDPFEMQEIYGDEQLQSQNDSRIALGNNLDYMEHICRHHKLENALQLIYVDPPFFSRSKYQASLTLQSPVLGKSSLIKVDAYDDFRAADLLSYLEMLSARFFLMRDLLADTGCILVHLDWHVAHYVKILLDQIFGRDNFINEIIWTYKSGGTGRKSFAKKHDTLLLYGKTNRYKFHTLKEKSYNRELKPYRFQGVEEFQDEKGWYTMVNMKDVWNINMVGRTSAERTGYATQKPEKLLERIVDACSDEGDLCADFFAGSGSFGAVCQRLGRRWILCDESPLATAAEVTRLAALQEKGLTSRGASKEEGKLAGQRTTGFSVWSVKDTPEAKLSAKVADRQLELMEYEPPENVLRCSAPEEMERFIREDSLSLIAMWSVDFAWDGKVHRAAKVFTSGERSVEMPEVLKIPKALKETTNIHIAGYDVFGNRFAVFVK